MTRKGFIDLQSATREKGLVVWLTGLSGAGKTTLARAVSRKLLEVNLPVELLDGDEVRETLSAGLGFSKQDRDANVRRIGFVARLLARNGVIVLASAISPYRQSRDDAKRSIELEGIGFVEVYVRCSLTELIRRDVKGLYRRALLGEIPNFTGVSDPYEEPLSSDAVIDTDRETIDQSVSRLIHVIQAHVSRVQTPVSLQPAQASEIASETA